MNESTQLFRFVIPGGFLIIYYLLFAPLFGFDRIKEIEKIKDISVLIIFLIPAFGYFSSSLHHLLYNLLPSYRIELNDILPNVNNYDSQWAEFNIRWRRSSSNPLYEAFDNRNNSLTDLMHGNGAIYISFLLSIFILVVRAWSSNHSFDITILNGSYVLLLIIICKIHLSSYYRTKNHTERYVKRALIELENGEHNNG
jgi:hypothetical protein